MFGDVLVQNLIIETLRVFFHKSVIERTSMWLDHIAPRRTSGVIMRLLLSEFNTILHHLLVMESGVLVVNQAPSWRVMWLLAFFIILIK